MDEVEHSFSQIPSYYHTQYYVALICEMAMSGHSRPLSGLSKSHKSNTNVEVICVKRAQT